MTLSSPVQCADASGAPQPPQSLSSRAVRHTSWNLLGVLLPFAVGLLAMPVLTRELGPARFGVLGLAWMLLEYFSLFDAGLGRATVRAVARRRDVLQAGGSGSERAAARSLSALVCGSIAIQVALGAAAGMLFAATAPFVVERMLNAPAAIEMEAVSAMRVLAATVPLLMLSLALRGMLEASERFDLSNSIRMPISVGTFVLPALIAVGGGGLPEMMLALLALRAVGALAQYVAVRRALPALSWTWPRDWQALRELLTFGGWVAISNVISPALIYLDRLVVGMLIGVVALGYYTAPFEASLRLLVVPAALVSTLYPMASALIAAGELDGMRRLYSGAVRALGISLAGVAAVGVVLAPELLTLWLGTAYAEQSATALRILCIGVLVNAVAHVPFAFLQAAGRPELMARFHLIELAIHIPATFWLINRFGISGAAIAWTFRALLDATLVFGAARRVLGVGWARLTNGRLPRAAVLLATLLVALHVLRMTGDASRPGAQGWIILSGATLLAVLHLLASWRWLLRPDERVAALSAIRRRQSALSDRAVAAAQPASTGR